MMSLRMRDDEPPFDDEPQRLFEGDFEHSILATHPDYDVSPDGQHFYMIRGERVEAESRLRVVVGWLDSVGRGRHRPRHLIVSFFSNDGDFKSLVVVGRHRRYSSQGLTRATPQSSKSVTFRVAMVAPRQRAMAAI